MGLSSNGTLMAYLVAYILNEWQLSWSFMGSVSTHFATSDFFGNQYLWIDCSEQEMAYKFLTAITYSADFQLSKNCVSSPARITH